MGITSVFVLRHGQHTRRYIHGIDFSLRSNFPYIRQQYTRSRPHIENGIVRLTAATPKDSVKDRDHVSCGNPKNGSEHRKKRVNLLLELLHS